MKYEIQMQYTKIWNAKYKIQSMNTYLKLQYAQNREIQNMCYENMQDKNYKIME